MQHGVVERFVAASDSGSPHYRPHPGARVRTHFVDTTAGLRVWQTHGPENFHCRYALISAELARLQGRELEAQHLYEEAVRSAREHGFVHVEGLAHERASAFYRARGFPLFAEACLREARAWAKREQEDDMTIVVVRRRDVGQLG